MKVLIVSHSCIVSIAQRRIELMAQQCDVEITLVVPNSWRYILRDVRLEKQRDDHYRIVAGCVVFNGHINGHFYGPATLLAVKDFRPDVLHIEQEPVSLCALQWLFFNQMRWHARTVLFTWENSAWKPGRLRRPLESFNLQHVDHIIAGSTGARDVSRHKGFSRDITIMPLVGVDEIDRAPEAALAIRRQIGLDTAFVVGYAGRLVQEKGLLDLIHAIVGLPAHAKLILLGNGPLRKDIEATTERLHVRDRVVLIDAVPHDQVADYIQAMDVFVLPSRSTPAWTEQFGHVLIEAMACGVPVIGSDSGAIPEVIADSGLIFPEGNIEALRACLGAVIDDSTLRASLGERGRARVRSEYTNAIIARKTLDVYRSLLL